MTHELTNRIYEAHSLGATGNSDARIHGLISTIVGRKDLEALKLLFNASDANWKTILCQPHFLPSFWCEQWYEGWEFIAPIFAKHPDNLGNVLDSVAANPQFSTVLVDWREEFEQQQLAQQQSARLHTQLSTEPKSPAQNKKL